MLKMSFAIFFPETGVQLSGRVYYWDKGPVPLSRFKENRRDWRGYDG